MICTAHKTNGEPCKAKAMKGFTVCRVHGAKGGRPPKHARYSKCLPSDLRERYEYYKSDPQFLNLLNEIAVARALFDKFVSNFAAGSAMSAEEAETLGGFLERISRLVEKEHKRRYGEQYTINLDGLNAFVAQAVTIIGEAIDKHVTDAGTASRLKVEIAGGLANIRGAGDGVEATAAG